MTCQTCGGAGYVRSEERRKRYFYCGCHFHTWCPDCTWRIARWWGEFMLWLRPIQ